MNTNTSQSFALMIVAVLLVGFIASRIVTQCQATLNKAASSITNVSK